MKSVVTSLPVIALLAFGAAAQSPFAAPVLLIDNTNDVLLSAADIDNDDDIDILRAGVGDVLDILVNDGQGRFTAASTVVPLCGTLLQESRFADVDNDGNIDIVAFKVTMPAEINVYRGLGNGTFGPPTSLPSPGGLQATLVGDANGDGFADLLKASPPAVPGPNAFSQIRWHFGTPAATFTLGSPVDTAGASRHFVIDIDGDGHSDVVQQSQVNFNSTDLVITLTTGTTFAPGGTITFAPLPSGFLATSTAIGFGDFDGDGDQDAVRIHGVFGPSNTTIAVLVSRRDGSSWTPLPAQTVSGAKGSDLSTGDFDADGDDDIILRDTSMTFLPSRGDATFANGQTINLTGSGVLFPRLIGAFDLNGDDVLDWIGAREYLLGAGVFESQGTLTLPGAKFFVDFDGDGDIDLLSGGFGLRRNRGDGVFTTDSLAPGFLPPVSAPFTGWSIQAVADFNGDGFQDFIAALLMPAIVGTTAVESHLLINDRNVQCADAGNIVGPGAPSVGLLDVIDFNHDLIPDVIGNTGVFVGAATAPFAVIALPSPFDVSSVGDADNDGDVDVLMVDQTALHTAWLFSNLGAGGFAATPLLSFVVPNNTAHFADLDGDGDLDVVCSEIVSSGPQTVNLVTFENLGPTTVPLRRNQNIDISPSLIIPADVDGDGRIDLVCAATGVPVPFAGNTGTVLRNLGGFAFADTGLFFGAPSGVQDLDGDGDLDMVGVNIWPNRKFTGPTSGRRLQYEAATVGTDNVLPVLGEFGPLRGGSPVEIRVAGAVGGSAGALAIGLGQDNLFATPVAGINTYVSSIVSVVVFFTSGPTAVGGIGRFTLNAMIPPMSPGTVFLQAAFFDPGTAAGFSCTNGLRLDIR